MRTEVYFCQPDKKKNPTTGDLIDIETCTYMGDVDLSNFDLSEDVLYLCLEGKINIYPYLTTIGKARVESVAPAPPFITRYIAIVVENENGFVHCPACTFDKYDNMIDSIKKKLGCDEETIKNAQVISIKR